MKALKPKTLGQALKLALEQASLTQVQLCVKIGESTTAINKLAKDRPSPDSLDRALITKIEKALELEAGQLWAFVGKINKPPTLMVKS